MTPQPASTSTPTRQDRRREETRRRLLAAARSLVARKGPDSMTIAEITETADVGFGSFYNHFESKEELVNALIVDAVESHGLRMDSITADLDDPAVTLATSVYLTVSMVDDDPLWAWFVVRTGLTHVRELGAPLASRLGRDIEVGVNSGRFDVDSVDVAVASVGGAVLSTMGLLLSEMLPADAEVQLTEVALRIVGLEPAEASCVAHSVASRWSESQRNLLGI